MSVKSYDPSQGGEVLRCGLLKKLKTSKKKWFVLRAETPESSARLEYYDSERKFNSGVPPKRSIPLKTCFNINKRNDTKHKNVIALYTKDDCFCVVLDTEEDLDLWLKTLLSLQHGEEAVDGETPRPTFEHVWQVVILNRGLGTGRTGNYRLCLTDKTLTLIKKDCENSIIDLKLTNIRSCGSLKNYFFLEIGRSSQLGAGELWMDSEDTNIAQNIHTTIFHAMSTNSNREESQNGRIRSSSATMPSKPNKLQGITGMAKPHMFSQDNPNTSTTTTTTTITTTANEPQTTQVVPVCSNTVTTTTAQHSIAGGGLAWSGNICHQRTQSLPLTAHPTTTNAPPTDNTPVHPCSRATNTTVKRPNQSSKCLLGGRERSDSMPSRPRTTSEGTRPIPTWKLIPHHRSHGRDISHSPPSGSPVSPPSVGCSTDSTGSSYSLTDETDVCTECPEPMRYSIPLTPDEAIVEEDYSESPCGICDNYVPMAPQSSDDGYVDMSPKCRHNTTASPSASMSSVTSGTPSTDIRFIDYPLDKVSSYLTSEYDDARPARAYSVGSRPETYRSKRHMELAGTPENSRVRAFSVGSKTKKGPCRVLPPHYPHPGVKSSSAPILSNSRTHSSHGSIGPMDDLMELDFSRSNSSTNSGYMEMKPIISKTPSGYVEMKPGVDLSQSKNNSSTDVSPYVDMSAGSSPYVDMSGSSPARNHLVSPQEEYSSFVDVNRQYHRLSSHETRNNNYMDMDQKKNRSTYVRASTSPGGYPWGATGDYLDMSGTKRTDRNSISSQLSSSPNIRSVSPKSDYVPLNMLNQDTAGTPEGYVEMNFGKKHQRQSSLDSNQITKSNEDYTNMSLGSGMKKKPMIIKKEKACSQPITITTTTTTSQVTKNSSSPISIYSLLGRKSSTGTPPRMHLPISSWATSPYSSLPRQRTRKDSHTNSKDSSSSSVTTPSSSSTIFPMSLNSPSSPMKPINKVETPTALKIPAAILSAIYKTNKSVGAKPASNDDYTMMDFETSKKPAKPEDTSEYVNYAPAPRVMAQLAKEESMDDDDDDYPGDYTMMQPSGAQDTKAMTLPLQKTTAVGDTSPLAKHLAIIGIDEAQAMCFRPIKEDPRYGSTSPRPGDVVPPKLTEDTKPSDTATTEGVESPYETFRVNECVSPAAKVSRPNSVNDDILKNTSPRPSIATERSRPSSVSSEMSRGGVSRPSSTSSEACSTVIGSRSDSVNSDCIQPPDSASKTDMQLHYASLDLAQAMEEEGSRSPRLQKGSPCEIPAQPQCEPTFIYAEIDFLKSEGLKVNNPSLPTNAKIKH